MKGLVFSLAVDNIVSLDLPFFVVVNILVINKTSTSLYELNVVKKKCLSHNILSQILQQRSLKRRVPDNILEAINELRSNNWWGIDDDKMIKELKDKLQSNSLSIIYKSRVGYIYEVDI